MKGIFLGVAAAAVVSASFAMAASLSLVGDKDCFGTNGACVEDGVTWVPGLFGGAVATASDPASMDRLMYGTGTWTHSFAPGAYSGVSLSFLTAGIGDIAGPYTVFADGVSVGSIPYDGGVGHILAETFAFAIPDALVSDGSLTVSFTGSPNDAWAVDYAELTTAGGPPSGVVPLPAAGLLLMGALTGLGLVRRRA